MKKIITTIAITLLSVGIASTSFADHHEEGSGAHDHSHMGHGASTTPSAMGTPEITGTAVATPLAEAADEAKNEVKDKLATATDKVGEANSKVQDLSNAM
jgi:ABC-type Zn2+ transport system substrate-binding protein/surface adhesin